MNPKVKDLANLMRAKKEVGEKFVLMLGAGASMSSGVKPTPTIMEELLGRFGEGIDKTLALDERFDLLWRRSPNGDRESFLKPYLVQRPSRGYERLAALVEAGYFDVALTFNFDELIERALNAAGVTDFKTIVRGESEPAEMQTLVDAREPAFKLVKLHGSLKSSHYFLFDASEMNEYPEPIGRLVTRLTARDIMICGYAFRDVCVIRAFSQRGGSIVSVNPSGIPRDLRGFVIDRRSRDWDVALGFDEFFEELHDCLLGPRTRIDDRPTLNPFKFLQSYDEADKDLFTGRDDEIASFKKWLAKAPPIVIVAGPAKAGKTSLVSAGLIPALDHDHYESFYVRCHRDFERALVGQLWPEEHGMAPIALPEAAGRLTDASPGKRVVLFLDQFERATAGFDLSVREDRGKLAAFLKQQIMIPSPNATIVLVALDETALIQLLWQACMDEGVQAGMVACTHLERKDITAIINTLATKGGLQFDQRIIDEMLQSYEQTRAAAPELRFTLAHVQAVCHMLAATRTVEYESYRRAFDNDLKALHQAINVCDIISFVEDFPWSDASWFRNMIKVALKENRERIAEFIKGHVDELVPPPAPPRRRRPAEWPAYTGRTP